MKKITIIMVLSLICGVFLISCQGENQNYVAEMEDIGSFSFGSLFYTEADELIQFEYNGEEVRISYHVEGWGEGIVSEFGWFLFVDGLPQPTRLETKNGGDFREISYMHDFALEFRERIEFYVVFTPISGNIGERIGLIASTILNPSFMPDDINFPIFGPFHNLSENLPAELVINSQPIIPYWSSVIATLQPIPKEILEEEKSRSDVLDLRFKEFVRMGIFPCGYDFEFRYEGAIFAKDGVANFSLFAYGGLEVASRITFFVNHQPIQVNDIDFIELQMEHGQMTFVDIELTLDNLANFNSLYAVMMTTGEDFHLQHIFKTPTLLLVNEGVEDDV